VEGVAVARGQLVEHRSFCGPVCVVFDQVSGARRREQCVARALANSANGFGKKFVEPLALSSTSPGNSWLAPRVF
jgi:hypothetical protein